MKRFFKWVGIILGSFIGVSIVLIAAIVIYDQLTRDNPNRNVEIVQIEPAPGGGRYELAIGRKLDGGKVVGWRIYRRDQGAKSLPAFPLVSWDEDLPPKIAWWSATDANICIPTRQSGLRFQISDNSVTTTSPGGQFAGSLNDFAFKVNQTCPAS